MKMSFDCIAGTCILKRYVHIIYIHNRVVNNPLNFSYLQITVNDIVATFTMADGLSDLFPHPCVDGEDNTVDHSATDSDKGVDGESIDVSHRAALELARRGELAVHIPRQYCTAGTVPIESTTC